MIGQTFRLSTYTLVTPQQGTLYSLYSMRTGQHALVNLGREPSLRILLEKSTFGEKDIPGEKIAALREEGFVVEAGADELVSLEATRACAVEADYGLRLAVMPTLMCNFACEYCFQGNHARSGAMATKTQDNLVSFAREILTRESQGPLVIMWFGGEPLLELPTMRSLWSKFKSLARDCNTEILSSLFTNGYYLDRLTPAVLDELQLTGVKVTLDGPEDVHNARRPLHGGGDTFDRIVENIVAVSRFYKGITIRINVDTSNSQHVPRLLSYLKGRGVLERCHYLVAPVDASTGSCKADGCRCLGPVEWSRVDLAVYRAARALGISDREQTRYPDAWPLACAAQIKHAYTVAPDGTLYKCQNDAPIRERAVYDLNERLTLNGARVERLRDSSPFGHSECQRCTYLPLCNAGCPSANIDGDSPGYSCTHLKFSLEERLDDYVTHFMESDGADDV